MAASKVDVWNSALRKIGETAVVNDENDTSLAARVCRDEWDNVLQEVFEARAWMFARRQLTITDISTQTTSATGDGTTTQFSFSPDVRETDQVTVTLDGTATTAFTVTPAADGVDPYVTFTSAPANSVAIVISVAVSRVGWDYVYSLPADYVKDVGLLPTDTRFQGILPQKRGVYEIMLNDAGDGYLLATDTPATDIAAFEYIAQVDHVPAWPAHFVTCVAWRLAVELAAALTKDMNRVKFAEEYFQLTISRAGAQMQNVGQRLQPPSPSEFERDD